MTVEDTIRTKLTAAFAPEALSVENDSARHAGHAHLTHHLKTQGRGPADATGQSHFNVTIVADAFKGLGRVARQRLVYDALKDELAGPVHALAVKAKAPGE
ncbi:DNA-binding transcriptional regulator BolA [Alphaproteobacteria bacterium SO-S41]|nr:DNA-binding transcriptional regulator BolA [Alphaproteobacteria bacterium SO-S41]